MADRMTVMSGLEGLSQDDWRQYHSDSEVQQIARDALELLKEHSDKQKQGVAIVKEPDCRICAQRTCRYYHELRKPTECKSYVRNVLDIKVSAGRSVKWNDGQEYNFASN